MEIAVKAKKWGSSWGIIIPKNAADELGLSEGKELTASFNSPGRSDFLRKIFGKGRGKGELKTAQEWKDEFRRTLYKKP